MNEFNHDFVIVDYLNYFRTEQTPEEKSKMNDIMDELRELISPKEKITCKVKLVEI